MTCISEVFVPRLKKEGVSLDNLTPFTPYIGVAVFIMVAIIIKKRQR